MQPNPMLRKLGFSDNDRVAIIHADDIGFCQSSVAALDGLLGAGIVSSMAAMVTCPWFPAVAAYYRAHPAMDLGVHFTVNCEYETYRWGPITTCNPASGLIDRDGYLRQESASTQKRAKSAAVAAELTAQIKRAQAAGIVPTHVDSHMLTAWHPKFLPDYLRIPLRYGIPPFFPRVDPAFAMKWGYPRRTAEVMEKLARRWEGRGMPLFDRIFVMPLENADDRIGTARRAMAALPPGLSYFILHPAVDSPELRTIAPDWRARVADYQAFTSAELAEYVRQSGIRVIGWRRIKDWLETKKRN
jgi:predicted glycoside hydrolase/deacetylase ChbG (UPF0249 family)